MAMIETLVTEQLYLADAALARNEATVIASDADGIQLDRTVFYARGGGQPGDSGALLWQGNEMHVSEAVKGAEPGIVLHVPAPGAILPGIGEAVVAAIDWPRRHRLMRMHTCLHLLCSLLPGAAVTGGQIGAERSRLDFDLPEPPPRDALELRLAALIAADHPVTAEWVDESVLDAQPQLVRTLSVKPPRGAGRIRLVRIGAGDTPVDLQPCGGTHVTHLGEIGVVAVTKIENKGRQNRRVTLTLVDRPE